MQILGLPAINATNLNHTPTKWKIDQSHLTVTLITEKRRKTYVVDAVMIGPLVINVGTMRQYSTKSSMERKQVSAQETSSDSNTDIESE